MVTPPCRAAIADKVLETITQLSHLDAYTIDIQGIVEPERYPIARSLQTMLSHLADLYLCFATMVEMFALDSETIFFLVQDADRRNVCVTVENGEELFAEICDFGPAFLEAREIERSGRGEDGLIRMGERVDEILEGLDGRLVLEPPETRTPSPYDILTWKLQHLHLLLSLALLSYATSHSGDFDILVFGSPARCFRITPTMTFRRREVGSLHDILGPLWILADTDAPFHTELHPDFQGIYDSSSDSGIERGDEEDEKLIIEPTDARDNGYENPEFLDEERTNRFLRPEGHGLKNTSRLFRISISILDFVGIWGPTEIVPVDEEKDLPADEWTKSKRIFALNGVVLPICMSDEDFENSEREQGVLIKSDEVLSRWFEVGERVGDDITLITGEDNPLGKEIHKEILAWALAETFDSKVKLLIE